MKRAVLPIALAASALAFAQAGFVYSDANTTVRAKSGLGATTSTGMHVELSGSVTMVSKSQKVNLRALSVVADLVAATKGKEGEVKQATATGGVHLEQTGDQGGRSTIDSNKAVYVKKGAMAQATLTGAVKIVSIGTERQTMVANGSSGVATLDPKAKGSRGLRAATLKGPVTVDIQQPAKGEHVVATGDRLEYSPAANPPTVVLTGHVRIQGRDNSSIGTLQGVGRLVITLNGKGEFAGFRINQ